MIKRTTLSVVLLLLIIVTSKGQSQKVLFTMEDAEELLSLVEENEKGDSASADNVLNLQKFYAIFKKYGGYKEINDSILLAENPFMTEALLIKVKPIKKQITDSLVKTGEDIFKGMGLEDVVVTGYSAGISSATWQTAVLDGTAKFLAQRFKEELAAYYINTFYDKIDSKPVVKALFPNTVSFLRVFANQVYNTDIATLQAASEEDLKNLPANLIKSLEYIDALNDKPLLKSGLALGLDIYKEHKAGISVAEIVNGLPFKSYLQDEYKSYLSILRVLVNSVRTSEPGNNEGPWEEMAEGDFFDFESLDESYFYPLLYEQLKNIAINGQSLKKCFKDQPQWVSWFHSVSGLFRNLQAFNGFLMEQKAMAKSKGSDLWETLLRTTVIVNEIFPIIDQIPNSAIKVDVSIRKVMENTQLLIQLVKKVQDKEYDQVVPNLIILLTLLDTSIANSDLVPYMRYAAVMAQFASVKTADDMKNLLESIALPIGSASIKRKSKWNISLNAYVGIAAGTENAKGKKLKQGKATIGLSAPIGIGISKQYKGINNNMGKGKGPFIPSGSIYLSFFDIGNLVNVRLKSDTTSIGEVRFSHFISLGAGYYVNFRNSPFTAGVSWSYVPGYRDVLIDKQWIYKADVMRFRFSIIVDIPILNFYTKPND